MNVNMWQHAATQENLAVLKARGVHIVEPNAGYLACGMTGPGRLAELDEILKRCRDCADESDLAGETLLVYRRTHLRGHRSRPLHYQSLLGKMGYAVAEAGHGAGRTLF